MWILSSPVNLAAKERSGVVTSVDKDGIVEVTVQGAILMIPQDKLLPLISLPKPFTEKAMPGVGRVVPGELELNKFTGTSLPCNHTVQPPSADWLPQLEQHVRYYVQQNIAPRNTYLKRRAFEAVCRHRLRACHKFLSAWPRGSGLGELLVDPVVDDTPARDRGVCANWWQAVVTRAAFVPTRVFVEAFVKPITRAAR